MLPICKLYSGLYYVLQTGNIGSISDELEILIIYTTILINLDDNLHHLKCFLEEYS
jgi:hypothetical protein